MYHYQLVEDTTVSPHRLRLSRNIARMAAERLPLPGAVEIYPMARTAQPGRYHIYSSEAETPSIGNPRHGCVAIDLSGAVSDWALAYRVALDCFQMAEAVSGPATGISAAEFARQIVAEMGF